MKLVAGAIALGLAQADCNVPDPSKVDCGYVGIDQQGCEAKGCCWHPMGSGSSVPWCYYQAAANCFTPSTSSSPPFSSAEVKTFTNFYLANINIQGSGAVVASPDHNTPGGDYYFHWERDGALSMRVLLETQPYSAIADKLKAYISWVVKVQNQRDPNGIDIRTEPKYTIPDGVPYTGGWCRPQTDGPGLRAATLIKIANTLISQGQTALVKQYLWTGSQTSYNGGAIKYDLDWVEANWTQTGCDLWEELHSDDFFWNTFNFKNALQLGADFAQKMGDSSSASRYQRAWNAVLPKVQAHWNGNFVQEASNRQVDGAVIVAFNDGYNSQDGVFGPTDAKVAATITNLVSVVCGQYPINQGDAKAGIAGVLLGRYPGDTYGGGNPWVLTSGALAQLFYRGGKEVLEKGKVSEEAMVHFRPLFGLKNNSMPETLELSRLFAASADGVLERIRHHVAADGFHMSEQIDKNTGYQTSAHDLTWSYAEVIKAMSARAEYEEAVRVYLETH